MKKIQLISASAGSGKTFRLMHEIAQRVSGKHGAKVVAPEHIMATTFTNKAASELKERIRLRLLEEGKAEEAQRIYDGLIGTVNGICAQLLKEYAFEAGISPAVDVLPEDDGKRIFHMATADAIHLAGQELEPIAKRMGLMGYGSGFSKQDDWRDFVRRIVDLARANAMDEHSLLASAQASWEALEALLGKANSAQMGESTDQRLKHALESAVQLIEQGEKVNKPATTMILKMHEKLSKGWELTWAEWMAIESVDIGKKGSDEVKGLWSPWASDAEGKGLHIKHPRFRNDLKHMIFGVFSCASDALKQYATYKKEQGLMDFVDQEVLVLQMATENKSFRASIKERVKLLMVDEFQDTSPIQLALFLKLSELAEEVVWVGDQKQSIYGFRGADPILMDAVAETIEQASGGLQADNVLQDSWRSKELLVQACNAIFSPVFHQMGADKVCLNIPEPRQVTAQGGWLEHWILEGSNVTKRSGALVAGIKDVIKERDINAGDIAVLCRSNSDCEQVAQTLNAEGIRASIAQGELLATQECTLALAALRYMVDSYDSIALAELVCFSHQHSGHKNWMQTLLQAPEETRHAWQSDALIEHLSKAGESSVYLTPLESLTLAMDTVSLERTIYAWGNVQQRLSNVDQLRAACVDYQDQCKSRRSSATVIGFLTWLHRDANVKQAESSGPQTVKVLTYHKSKGLEWPVVVMNNLNKASRSGVFGVSVTEAQSFDAENPLHGRSLRFWPWAYGTKKRADAMSLCLDSSDIAAAAQHTTLLESQRLLYVGMTRARDGLVFASELSKNGAVEHQWLSMLQNKDGAPVMCFADEKLKVEADSNLFEAKERMLSASEDGAIKQIDENTCYLPESSTVQSYPSASIAPSGVSWDDVKYMIANEEDVLVTSEKMLGEPLPLSSNVNMADFGQAMHGFLGADIYEDTDKREQQAIALLARWGVANALKAEDMLKASDRFQAYLASAYPKAVIKREYPMRMVRDNHQQLHGWLDMLVEVAEGFVIIDHKSFPGAQAVAQAKAYAPQLAVYKQAVEQATGKPVLKTLIHMPVVGEVFDVVF